MPPPVIPAPGGAYARRELLHERLV
jgi:hypothetical protein